MVCLCNAHAFLVMLAFVYLLSYLLINFIGNRSVGVTMAYINCILLQRSVNKDGDQ